MFSDSADIDVIELEITVNIPADILKYTNRSARYKYCVFSNANQFMETPYEFFTGALATTVSGSLIDRSLRLENLCMPQKG